MKSWVRLAVWRSGRQRDRLLAVSRTGLRHRALPIALIALGTALVLPSLIAGLQLDDYVLLGILAGREPLPQIYPSRLDIFNFFGGTTERTRRMLDLGLLPWWTFPESRVAFWRPLAALTHWVDLAAWPHLPFLMHVQNVLWFNAVVVAVALMYRQLMRGTWVAGLAALLYAIDEAHAVGVGWVSGRNVLIATVFGAIALLSHDRWRRTGSRAWAVVAPTSLALSLLAVEGAAAIGGYVVAHALCIERGSWGRRLVAILPTVAVLLTWQLVYFSLGYGVLGAAPGYLSPLRDPVLFIWRLAGQAPVMLLAQWGGPAAETYASLPDRLALVRVVASIVALSALGFLFIPLLRRNPVARFWAVGQVLALVPLGAVSTSDRYLFFVGLGTMALIAQFIAGWADGEDWRPATAAWRVPAAALAGLLVLLHCVVAPISLFVSSMGVARLGAVAEEVSDSMPADPEVRHQILVIPTVPFSMLVSYSFFIRAVKRQPISAHIRLLAAGAPVELYRPDARTLVVRLLGPAERTFRAPQNPMAPGARVDLTGIQVEVTAVDAGLPREATFRFDADLDSGRFRWIRWAWAPEGGARYVPFAPPPIGERVRVE